MSEVTTITVAGVSLNAPRPFTSGHVLSENEAGALNQLLAENLRNNFAGVVKKAIEEVEGIENLDIDALQTQFDEYADEYEFGQRRGSRLPVDPVKRAAVEIARSLVRDALKAKGYKLSGKDAFPKDNFDNLVEAAAGSEKVLEMARAQVDGAQSIAADVLAGLSN